MIALPEDSATPFNSQSARPLQFGGISRMSTLDPTPLRVEDAATVPAQNPAYRSPPAPARRTDERGLVAYEDNCGFTTTA